MLQHNSVRKQILKQRRFRELLILLLLVGLFLGYSIVSVEKSVPNSVIKNHFDGMYWAMTTLTTVGYGDLYPVTVLGKIIAMALQLIGSLIFGTLIALVSAYFIRTQEEFLWVRMFERIDRLEEEVAKLHKETDFLVKAESDTPSKKKETK